MLESPFDCVEHTITAQHVRGYFRSTASPEDTQLQLAVKQYIPKDNPTPQLGDVTIVACHAAGMAKELWVSHSPSCSPRTYSECVRYEPLFEELHRVSKNPTNAFRIRGIWIADVEMHGQSGLLKE